TFEFESFFDLSASKVKNYADSINDYVSELYSKKDFLNDNYAIFVIFSCIAFFGTAFVNSLNWALVPDTVDYGEWKTGIRAEGSV
ncbi:DUF4427 domain-containing protein, partial [Salmonella enterica subsp. enterica serovar Cerro]|nr:DUF4427 domain-containing protein [Salmonella enterica subsp. enterica serovar Cerro]